MSAFIEGRNAILEALRSGMPLERVYLAEGTAYATPQGTAPRARPADAVTDILALADAAHVDVEEVSRRWLDERSDRGAHQGVMASAAPFAFTPLESLLSSASDKTQSLLVALDHLTDAGNFGAIARSAEVAGADGLVITKRRSAPIGVGAYKASAGALAWIPVAQEPNLVRALAACKKAGYWVVGASELAPNTMWSQPLEGRLVLVLGSEGTGLSRLTVEACDFTASLPVSGHVGSLNVAQAAAVFIYEWVRRTRGPS